MGSPLDAANIEDPRRRGFHSVIDGVTLPNKASVRLHERLGLVFVGRLRHAGHTLERWHDVGFWQLMLRDGSPDPRSGGSAD